MDFNSFLDFTLLQLGKHQIKVFQLLMFLVVLVVTQVLIAGIQKFLKRQEERNKLEKGHAYSIGKILQYFLWTIAIIILLQTSGVDLTILVAGSAALLVGLSLGINRIFSDFISGILILFEGIIRVGDVVEVSGRVAQVIKINLRTTQVRGRDNISVIIPNSKFVQEEVVNWSHMREKTRFEIRVSVAYGSDLEKVKQLLYEAATENPNVSKDQQPEVRLLDYGESALILLLLFWGDNEFRVEGVKSKIRYAIYEKFRQHGVQIPFPQRVVHFPAGYVSPTDSAE